MVAAGDAQIVAVLENRVRSDFFEPLIEQPADGGLARACQAREKIYGSFSASLVIQRLIQQRRVKFQFGHKFQRAAVLRHEPQTR